MRRVTIALLALFAVCALPALAQTAPAMPQTRGALLYATHCIACHSTQMHWRDKRSATDWASLKAEVRRWQGNAQLRRSEDDITEVARHLNTHHYHYPQPTNRLSSAPLPGAHPS